MGAELDAGGFGRGEQAEKHDKKGHRSTQVRGSRKEITPLLLLNYLHIWIYGVHNNGASKLSMRGGRRTAKCRNVE
jgi:hypothetical protein